jgi:hypothetical protein
MGGDKMSEQDKKIADTFERVMPTMSEMDKERLLAFGEGMAFMAQMQKDRQQDEAPR